MEKSKDSSIKKSSETQSPQCQYFVVRKKRLCRMTVRPGRQYCGEHEPQPKHEDGQVDTRVPCPNDPKHTCYISKLQKHLAICNARQGDLPPYIVKGINASNSPEDGPRPLLSEVPREIMEHLIEKVNMLYDKYVKDTITTVVEQPIHPIVLDDYEQSDRTESSRRHLRQASSLLRLAEAEGLVRDRTCYVELGAGKGHMSYYAWRAWCEPTRRASCVLLVDRASLRHKRDNKLRDLAYTTARDHAQDPPNENRVSPTERNNLNSTQTSNGSPDPDHKPNGDDKDIEDYTNVTNGADTSNMGAPVRLRADLADLALDKVPVVQECDRVVGFAKHLCGVATDFALRCIMADGLGDKTQGVVIATCCHHRCQSSALVGVEHLYELGLTAQELGVLYGVVSWATCGDGRSRQRRRDAAGETAEVGHGGAARAAAGRRAKALLDWARARRLAGAGLRARLCRFVPAAVSPENIAIVATKRR